jgi:hypothetical protein
MRKTAILIVQKGEMRVNICAKGGDRWYLFARMDFSINYNFFIGRKDTSDIWILFAQSN